MPLAGLLRPENVPLFRSKLTTFPQIGERWEVVTPRGEPLGAFSLEQDADDLAEVLNESLAYAAQLPGAVIHTPPGA